MNPRKRQAPEAPYPPRSSKQPRTCRSRYTGEHASPSQVEGLLGRWRRFAHEFGSLCCETAGLLMTAASRATQLHTSSATLPLTASHSLPEPLRPVPSPPPPASQSAATLRPVPDQPVAGPSKPRVEASSTQSAPPPPPPPPPLKPIQDNHHTSYPEIDAALQFSQQRKTITEKRKRIPSRDHIYARNHKAHVKMEREKERERLLKELYNRRRSAGYGSDFRTFQGYVKYQQRLEELERSQALSPSPSLIDLRSKSPASRQERRYSESSASDYVGIAFLARSLEKAKETLNSPRPPKPFIPSFDQLRISARSKDNAIEHLLRPKRSPLPTSLPPEDEAQVEAFLSDQAFRVKCGRETVVHKDLQRLRPCQWLNDEIINFYGALIMARWEAEKKNRVAEKENRKKSSRPGHQLLDVHYFSTFFWTKLVDQGYEMGRLAKWTKMFDIFAKDVVVMAVNHSNSHWTAAAINFRKKRFESYDSMGFSREAVFRYLRVFIDTEHRLRKKQPFDFTGWEDYTLSSTPQQENGYDCGVFTCQFMESLSRGEESFNFTQSNMPYLRKRMIWEIGNTKLRDD